MSPMYEQHSDHGIEHKLDEIIRQIHKLNRKVERLAPDFSKEDKIVKAAKARIPPSITPNPKGK